MDTLHLLLAVPNTTVPNTTILLMTTLTSWLEVKHTEVHIRHTDTYKAQPTCAVTSISQTSKQVHGVST